MSKASSVALRTSPLRASPAPRMPLRPDLTSSTSFDIFTVLMNGMRLMLIVVPGSLALCGFISLLIDVVEHDVTDS